MFISLCSNCAKKIENLPKNETQTHIIKKTNPGKDWPCCDSESPFLPLLPNQHRIPGF